METDMRLGRIFTIFTIECRFGLPLGKFFILQCAGDQAAVILLQELAPIEFVDPTNTLVPTMEPGTDGFRLARPIALPSSKDIYVQAMTMASKETLNSPAAAKAALADSSPLVIFEPLGIAASIRSRFATEIAIVVERDEAAWQALGQDKFDETHSLIWDEFVRTYHMITGDVRPPFWNDSHQLMIVKQGWVPYESFPEELHQAARLQLPCEVVPVKRHRILTSYSQEGTFLFQKDKADVSMRRYLEEGAPVPLSRETLAGAQRAVELHRSGKTAIVECVIALEVAVTQVVNAAKLNGGVSKKKLDDYKNEIGLGYQLNVDLPLILSPLSDKERAIIGLADAVRKRRNEIVHEGAQPTREEGQQAVDAVRSMLDFLCLRGLKV